MTRRPPPPDLAESLRAAARDSGLSGQAIARAAGVSQSVVARWLKGERDLTLATAARVARGLGLTALAWE